MLDGATVWRLNLGMRTGCDKKSPETICNGYTASQPITYHLSQLTAQNLEKNPFSQTCSVIKNKRQEGLPFTTNYGSRVRLRCFVSSLSHLIAILLALYKR